MYKEMLRDLNVIDEVVIEVPDGKLVFKRVDDNKLRIIKTLRSFSKSTILNLNLEDSISLRPRQPSGNVINTQHILVKFSEPITLLPKSSVSLNIKLPIDLGIFVRGILVDTIPLSMVKYSLYGPSDFGELCRYVDRVIIDSTPKDFLGSLYITINSTYDDNLTVNKVVLPSEGLSIFVTKDDEVIFGDVNIKVISHNYVEVLTKSRTSLTRNELKYAGRAKELSYIMKFGV
ncbi:MAG: DUF432 domain-containing protein [Sulfolobales archaeon]